MRFLKRGLMVLLAGGVLLAPVWAGASEENGSGSRAAMDFIGKVVNFVVLFGGLAFFLRKPLKKYLTDRMDAVRLGLREAEDSSREAQAKLRSIEERAGRLQSDIDEIQAKARAAGQAEKERILQAARREADRLRDFSRQEVDALVRADIRQLKEYASDKAIALALERIRAGLTAEAHGRLIDTAIERLAEMHEKRDSDSALRPRAH